MEDVGTAANIDSLNDAILISDPAFREQSSGLCNERQHYLYSTIFEFCSSEETADILCPKLTIPLPEKKVGRPKKASSE